MSQMNSPKNSGNNTLLISPSYLISTSFFDNFQRKPIRSYISKNVSTISNPGGEKIEIENEL